MNGYLHLGYTASLSEFGAPRNLIHAQGYILDRAISGSSCKDAIGPYPLFCCQEWEALEEDFKALEQELVSLTLVADPFGNYTLEMLQRAFNHVALFKEHFVTRLDRPVEAIASKHHRYYARKAFQQVEVSACSDPAAFLDDWMALYDALIIRHELRGIKAFSRQAFLQQLAVPGMVVLKATREGETVGAHLWYVQNNIAYSHLAASSAQGYQFSASYALYWHAIEHFAGKVDCLEIGSGAGTNSGDSGLTEFKRGWATETRPVYLCGKIFDAASYAALTRERTAETSDFFPAYRKGEF